MDKRFVTSRDKNELERERERERERKEGEGGRAWCEEVIN
jgi:hypothetical protein